jgi:hypothetical protein
MSRYAREPFVKVNFYGITPIAFAATGVACPPLADNFIYGFTPMELR